MEKSYYLSELMLKSGITQGLRESDSVLLESEIADLTAYIYEAIVAKCAVKMSAFNKMMADIEVQGE